MMSRKDYIERNLERTKELAASSAILGLSMETRMRDLDDLIVTEDVEQFKRKLNDVRSSVIAVDVSEYSPSKRIVFTKETALGILDKYANRVALLEKSHSEEEASHVEALKIAQDRIRAATEESQKRNSEDADFGAKAQNFIRSNVQLTGSPNDFLNLLFSLHRVIPYPSSWQEPPSSAARHYEELEKYYDEARSVTHPRSLAPMASAYDRKLAEELHILLQRTKSKFDGSD